MHLGSGETRDIGEILLKFMNEERQIDVLRRVEEALPAIEFPEVPAT